MDSGAQTRLCGLEGLRAFELNIVSRYVIAIAPLPAFLRDLIIKGLHIITKADKGCYDPVWVEEAII
jgi:hypothetical protein